MKIIDEINGVPYTDYLAGPDGVSIILYILPSHTKDQISKAKHMLYNERDVVSIRTRRVKNYEEITCLL